MGVLKPLVVIMLTQVYITSLPPMHSSVAWWVSGVVELAACSMHLHILQQLEIKDKIKLSVDVHSCAQNLD